ncbi:MAG: helix-turn-helix domain-containing protein [Bacteroidales bacterium]|nr:helix-turn-helix domain-containing protein [Bacteroidales bacterium]MCF8390400.1 helix-turn-helix domain-containing protein [Bacteroidales bacterium]
MSIIKTKNILERLDFLVRMRSTGCAGDLADQMGLSERTLFNYLNELKDLGAPLFWSRQENSYVYGENGKIEIGFKSTEKY